MKNLPLVREYLLYYRGQSFLAVVLLSSFTFPSPAVSKLSLVLSLSLCRRSSLHTDAWGGAKSYELRESLFLYKSVNFSLRLRQGDVHTVQYEG
jgi:hypothetical protein